MANSQELKSFVRRRVERTISIDGSFRDTRIVSDTIPPMALGRRIERKEKTKTAAWPTESRP